MWLMLIPIGLCLEACYHDCLRREIPDQVPIRVLVSGLLVTGLSWSAVNWIDATLGVLLGFVVVLPFAWNDGVGGGDLKLVSALGAWLGPIPLLGALFWIAMSGLLMAIVSAIRGQTDFAYAPAITAGLTIAVLFPQSLTSLIEGIRTWI